MRWSIIAPALVGAVAAVPQTPFVNYTTVTGYFLQDEATTNPSTFNYTAVNFGLINRTYPADKLNRESSRLTQWERFYNQVSLLNAEAPHNVEYKVLFMGRHGEGWHNAAESYYGTPAWNCYWAELLGNGTANWWDAALTNNGVNQALIAHNFWKSLIEEQNMHMPDKYFTSPLTRCLQTANLTFTGIDLPGGSSPFVPLIKELLRESISIHTCDHRHNRTYIHEKFPHWPIEAGFTEQDELWNGVTAETSAAQYVRSQKVLDSIFFANGDSKKEQYISITSHSGEIGSLLQVLNHQSFGLSTGAVIPVLVKAERLLVPTTTTTTPTWTPNAHCTVPPLSSNTACVCPSGATPVSTPLVTSFV